MDGPLFQYIHGMEYSKREVKFFFDRFIGDRRQDYFFIVNDKGAIFWILPGRNYSVWFGLKMALDYLWVYGVKACFRLIQLGLVFDSLKKKIGKHCIELNCFGVLPEFQGQGIGSRLIEQSFRELENPDNRPFFFVHPVPAKCEAL